MIEGKCESCNCFHFQSDADEALYYQPTGPHGRPRKVIPMGQIWCLSNGTPIRLRGFRLIEMANAEIATA